MSTLPERQNPWQSLVHHIPEPEPGPLAWLVSLLARNAGTAYLKQFGSPMDVQSFRTRVPPCCYEDLDPFLQRMIDGEADVLFRGRPVAYERTGGSSGGMKLIPYSAEGLLDFQRNILPWLAEMARTFRLNGSAYFAISPATRTPETVGDITVGLPDGAYLGEVAGTVLANRTAVPFSVGALQDVDHWREQTLACLKAADDLEIISVWSPGFLLRLLEDIPDPVQCWPRLKVVSCWASAHAQQGAEQLGRLLPHATIQPKGLLSTEAVVTTPDAAGQPLLVPHGFVEFVRDGEMLLEHELTEGREYEVLVTTASGLYRYQTGDRVRHTGYTEQGRPMLEFMGRNSLSCDLVGEKLTEAFVARCLNAIPGFALLVPDVEHPGYVLVSTVPLTTSQLAQVEGALCANPQYAYARKLGQLGPLRAIRQPRAFAMVEQVMLERGVRLGDIKPLALRTENFWLLLFEKAFDSSRFGKEMT